MGLEPDYLDYIQECVVATMDDFTDKRMLELGNQLINAEQIQERTGKTYYRNRGVLHTSFDLNGKDGAIRVDLSKPIGKKKWLNAFDIVTNSGTSEHVEPFETQYECFKNIHNCLKIGGIAIHIVPDAIELEERGLWKGHCNNYYTHEFFALLAELNGYQLISSKVINGTRCACLQKVTDSPFTSEKEELLAAITRKEGGIVYLGINDDPKFRLFTGIYARVLDVAGPVRRLCAKLFA